METLTSLEQDLLKTKLLFFEGYIGSNYEYLSARHWNDEITMQGGNCFVTNSYQPIIDGLLKNSRVQLNTMVKKINTRANDMEVITENAAFYADAILVTVPLGVLKKNVITFNPPLPENKQKAIQRLGMGLFNMTAMKFPTVFWPKESPLLIYTQFDSHSISVFLNLYYFTQQPILIGFSGGETARQLEAFSETALIQKIMQNFKTVFGTQLPQPDSSFTTRWSSDPYSYGSYSYLAVGASVEDYETLAMPLFNRIFFAGEATHASYPSTTHGAYLSGIREAERIINLTNVQVPPW